MAAWLCFARQFFARPRYAGASRRLLATRRFVHILTGHTRLARLAVVVVAAMSVGLVPDAARAGQAEPIGACTPSPPLVDEPPLDSPILFTTVQLCWPTQGNVASVDYATYLFYMESDELRSVGTGQPLTPFDARLEQVLFDDFERLWDTDLLTNLSVEILDDPYPNGVGGKRAVFLLEERDRVRTVTYDGSDEYDLTEINEAMEQSGIELRMDSRIGPRKIRQVEGLLREMYGEKGYQFAEVSHEITAVAGGPKIVQLTFTIDQGPKVRVDDISFVGNEQISERSLKGQMKNTREPWLFSFITGRGTYKPLGYEQDAVALEAHYRNNGFIDARVGQPGLEYLDVSEDGKTRGLRLRIRVDEGERYRIGSVSFEGQEVVRVGALEEIFSEVRSGDYYSDEAVRDALLVAKEAYGSVGYYEMTSFPSFSVRAEPQPDGLPTRIDGNPVVDLTMNFQEGEQYFINRINFIGNNTTHDEVIRREISLIERNVFNTEALKFSVRRLNQLGYFEPLDEENAIQIEKRPGVDNEVDLTINLQEANLNQLTFGAGASQFDGFFLQLGFTTTNFLGRGESLTVQAQNGERIKNYNVGFTEPYLFGQPITAGLNLFRRDIRFINQFTQSSVGATTSLGRRVRRWSQFFVSYSYEETVVKELNPLFLNPNFLRFNPFLQDALLLGQGGARTISKVTPTFLLNTVDHPIFPSTGKKYTLSFEYAGLGGNTKFYKPIAEGIWYLKHARRLSIGFRARGEYISPIGGSVGLPIFSLLTMGGDFSVRGFDIRSIGPSDPSTGLVLGGNKSILFNLEYLISIADPVRLVFFYDAGQVVNFGQHFATDRFRTSTGAEVRFFMPVLNVPFRLIYVFNPQRGNVLNDRFQPQESSLFKFAIGTTF